MHSLRLLHKRLVNSQVIPHKNRVSAVMKTVKGLLSGGTLTLTHLGRSLSGKSYEKHKIKCVDRLLGNTRLHSERQGVYRQLGQWVLCQVKRPVIVVDWSDVYEGQQFMMLTASIPMGGRTLTLYEAVYPMKQYNSPKAHQQFLRELAQVVPKNKQPIIVTDAGFRGPWFRAVEALGWDWVGRLRKGVHCSLDQGDNWHDMTWLYRQARRRIRYVGQVWFSTKRPYTAHVYLVKKNLKGKRPLKRRGDDALATLCRKLYRDPWVLVTSLPHRRGSAKRIETLYTLRMQIEETFRELKNGRWGLGLEYARSQSASRLENLLLIGTLGLFVLWLDGVLANMKGWARHFQANTVKRRTILSVFFLGKRLQTDTLFDYSMRDSKKSLRELANLAKIQVDFVGIT